MHQITVKTASMNSRTPLHRKKHKPVKYLKTCIAWFPQNLVYQEKLLASYLQQHKLGKSRNVDEEVYLPGTKIDSKEKITIGRREYPTRLPQWYKSMLPYLPTSKFNTMYTYNDASDVQPRITPKCNFPARS